MVITGVMRIIWSGIVKKFLKNDEQAVINPSKIPRKSEIKKEIITLRNVARKLFQNSRFVIIEGKVLSICTGDGRTKTEFILIARNCHKPNIKRIEHKYAIIFVAVFLQILELVWIDDSVWIMDASEIMYFPWEFSWFFVKFAVLINTLRGIIKIFFWQFITSCFRIKFHKDL